MRRLFLLFMLFAASAAAQTQTLVSGTLTDPNGVAYYPATVTACLNPSTLNPTVAGQPVNPRAGANYCIGPTNTSASGSFSMALWGNANITPGGTTWIFTVQASGTAPPAGNGTLNFSSAGVTVSGATQDVSTNINSAGTAQLKSGSTVSNGSINPVSFGAKFDGKGGFGNVDTIVVTNGSNQVTDNHGAFSSADVGKQFTASNGCCGVTLNYTGTALFPQVGMHICKATDSGSSGVGVVNSTTINLCKDSDGTVANATSNCSGVNCMIAWATNDDAAITAAEAQWQTSGKCGSMNLPAGITAVLKGHFNNPGSSCLGMEPQADYTAEVDGEGIGVTVIGLFSGFDFTTCTSGTGSNVCFGGYLESSFQNLQWNGFGLGNTAAGSAKKLIGPQLGSQWSQVACNAFGGSDANLTGFSFDGAGVRVWGVSIDGCGNTGAAINGTIAKCYYCFFGDTLGPNLTVNAGGDFTDFGSDYGATGGTIVINQSGRYHGVGSNLFSCSVAANATAIYMANGATSKTILDGARFNCGSTTSNGVFMSQAGETLILTGGTVLGGTTAAARPDAGTIYIDRTTSLAAGLITGTASGVIIADGHSVTGICTGVGTAASTLALRSSGDSTTGTGIPTTCTSTTLDAGIPVSGAVTALHLKATATAAGTNASSGMVTVLKNGGATTITCTIGTGTSCVDTTHSVAFADGDLISFQFTTQAADTLAGVKAQIIWQ